MTNVISNTILSCQYKTSFADKLIDRKVHFFALRNKKYAKKGTRKFVQLLKLDAAKINTFTVFRLSQSEFRNSSCMT